MSRRFAGTLEAVLPRVRAAVVRVPLPPAKGRVRRIVGPLIRASLGEARLGELCELFDPTSGAGLFAEVIGFDGEEALLTPIGDTTGLSTRTEVAPTGRTATIGVGPGLLGRVVDGLGEPLDDGPAPATAATRTLAGAPPQPLASRLIDAPLPTGIRALDALLTCGEGQRVGVFGPPGAGKSRLLAGLVRHAAADVVVVGLIGERGREVREFWEGALDAAGRARSVAVVATAERSPIERIKAAQAATAVAEWFRDQGARVLLLVDSVTRLARALRKLGLAAGEPPSRRGFPPSVFEALPRLFERAGRGAAGSITAFYTVLVEADDDVDPIAEEVKSLLDGHIVLTRRLAGAGRFPAVDVLQSVSRVMPAVADASHQAAATRLRAMLARHAEIEILVQVGEFKPGSDALADAVLERLPAIEAYLRQPLEEPAGFAPTIQQLRSLAA